jgi:hypothetical protein
LFTIHSDNDPQGRAFRFSFVGGATPISGRSYTAEMPLPSDNAIVKPDTEPKLTFWSIPPFRQRLRVAAKTIKTIKVRDARLLLTQIYGMLYFVYGMKVPVILLVVVLSLVGTSSPAVDSMMTAAIPYVIFAAIGCGLAGAVAGAGTAWIITGRAMRSRRQDRLRWASAGALGAALPVIPLLAVVPESPALIVAGFLLLLFGGGMGWGFHCIVQRDRVDQAEVT